MMQTETGLDQKQVHRLWESMVGAHVLADYFVHLANSYGRIEQASRVSIGMLCFVGAFLLFSDSQLGPWAGLMALIAGAVTLVGALLRFDDKKVEAVWLHSSWAHLGIEYEALWSDSYHSDAGRVFVELEKRGAELSERALRMPCNERRMTRRLARSAARVHPHFATVASGD